MNLQDLLLRELKYNHFLGVPSQVEGGHLGGSVVSGIAGSALPRKPDRASYSLFSDVSVFYAN